MARIKVKNLTKRYGKTAAVENLNLDIKDGEFFVLLGPSGCGKTTALLSIAGLLKVDDGEITIGDMLVASPRQNVHVEPQKRGTAMVFRIMRSTPI